jgi:hypothetical protein
MKENKFFVQGMLAMVLALGLVFAGCATGPNGGGNGLVATGGDGSNYDDDDVIGVQVWKKEQFYSTEANPWTENDHSLTLVFTERQLTFRYDSNGDGDFEDAGEYTYTYTITNFGGNDWRGKLGEPSLEGDYEREITLKLETKTGSGTNVYLSNGKIFVVTPNLDDNGKIDGTMWLYISTDGENYQEFRFGKNQ